MDDIEEEEVVTILPSSSGFSLGDDEDFLLVRGTENIGNNIDSTYSFPISTTSVHDNSSSCYYFKSFLHTCNSIESSSFTSFFFSSRAFSLSLSLTLELESQTRIHWNVLSVSAWYSPVILDIFLSVFCFINSSILAYCFEN